MKCLPTLFLIPFLAIAQVSYASPGSVVSSTAGVVSVSSASTTAEQTPGAILLNARKSLHGPFRSLVLEHGGVVSLNDLAGQTIEISARISGVADISGQQMLLLDSKSGSISVSVPHDLESDWLTAGSNIRALVYVPDLDTLARLNRIVPLIASAPEISVEKAEEAEAEAVRKADLAKAKEAEKLAVQFAAQERRFARGKETSRSAAYNFRSASLPSGTGPICQLSANALRVYPAYRAFVHQANRRLGDKTVDSITSSILYFCEKEKVDPRLMISMILAESNFDPNSTSRVGAMGLGQLMPGTAAGLGVQNAYDPIQNIAAAAHILSVRIRDYGGCRDDLYVPQRVLYLTMAAYNAGPGAVKKYGGVPPYRETQRYVRKVEQYYIQLSGGS